MDGSLTQGTSYSFFVRAIASAGTADSSIVSATTPNPPATPSGATVTFLSSTEIDLQWVDNADNETGYTVLRRTGTADFSPIASLPPNSTSYQDTTVSPGLTYDYHIEAYNISGYSDFTGLTVTTPSVSSFQSYMTAYGITNPSLATPTADPYNIGIPNLLTYAFNLNPTVSSPTGLPIVTQENGHLTIAFIERISATDLNYIVEVSGDMTTWNSGPTYTTQVSVTPIDAVTQLVTVSDNTLLNTAPERFIRVTVTH
jgi:hypothetical protein